MMAPWLTVITTPRRQDYLASTIAAIDAAGGLHDWKGLKFLYVDGNSDDLLWKPSPSGWLISSQESHGNAANSLRVLKDAAKFKVPYVLFFEDDLKISRNAIPVMAELEVPSDCWALQFCDLRSFGDPRSDEIRIFRQSMGDDVNVECDPKKACTMWGNQALKIPERTLKLIAESKIPDQWEAQHGPHNADTMFSLISLEQKEAPYLGIVAPSLVKHVGSVRSMNNEGRELDLGRSARNFPGEDFDARSLLK